MVVGGLGRSRWWPKTLVTQSHVIDVKSGEGSCEGSLFCFGGWLILMFCLRSECCCCFRFLCAVILEEVDKLREQLFFFVGESVRVVPFGCYWWLLPGLVTAMVIVYLWVDWVCWYGFFRCLVTLIIYFCYRYWWCVLCSSKGMCRKSGQLSCLLAGKLRVLSRHQTCWRVRHSAHVLWSSK